MAPFEIRRLGAGDAEAFSALRQAVTAQDPVGMGLSLEDAPEPSDPASTASAGTSAGGSSGTARVQPSLTTARLVLRPFVREDAGEVQRLAGDARVAAGTLLPHPYPDGLAQTWIEGHRAAFDARREVVYAVTQRDSGKLVGAVSLLSIVERHARAEIGFWIGPEHWGQGYCTEAIRELMAFGAGSLGITRFVGRCVAWNVASAAVMVKAGMSPEGRLPKHEFRGGQYVDQLLFGCVLPGRGPQR